MKKEVVVEDEHELEIIKAVAQAWHGHSSSSSYRATTEFDAYRKNFKSRPSRFELEAMNNKSFGKETSKPNWDFQQSLWDSYEIVTVSKRLEAGLVLDDPFSDLDGVNNRVSKRHRGESKNSLRNLFNQMSYSRRFKEPSIHKEGGT